MGGEHSGVTEATTDILIECAYFDPERIALHRPEARPRPRDARSRFERGVDPGLPRDGPRARDRAGDRRLPAARPSQIVRAGTPPRRRTSTSTIDPARCARARRRRRAGRAGSRTSSSGSASASRHGETWRIAVPSWRRDVDGAADIVEEVVRIEGYDKVAGDAAAARARRRAADRDAGAEWSSASARRAAAARGLNEAVTWSFISEAEAAPFGGAAWIARQPDQRGDEGDAALAAARPARRGARATPTRGADSVAPVRDRPALSGRRRAADARPASSPASAAPRDWRSGKARGFDAFDAKAEALAMLAAAGAPVDNLQVLGERLGDLSSRPVGRASASGRRTCSPNSASSTRRSSRPSTSTGRSVAAEIFLDAIPQKRGRPATCASAYAPPALQAVTRDFAFLVPADAARRRLAPRGARRRQGRRSPSVRLFDVFTGAGVPEGQKSLAVEVTLQPGEKSFTEEELKAISDRIVAAAAKARARRFAPDAREEAVRAAFAQQAGWCTGSARPSPPCSAACSASGSMKHRARPAGARLARRCDRSATRCRCGSAAGSISSSASGAAPALAALYPPHALPDADALWGAAPGARRPGFAALARRPPQTNEVGRSAVLMSGLLTIAARFVSRSRLLELGASAGFNLLLDHYGYDLGGLAAGDPASPLRLEPEWTGPPPPGRGGDRRRPRGRRPQSGRSGAATARG